MQGHAKSKDESSVSNTEKEVPRWEIVPQKTAKFKPNFYKRNTRRTTVRRDPEDDSSYPLASNEGETGLPLTDKDLQIPYAQLNDAQCRHHARVLVHESRRMCQNFREGSCGWQSSLFSYCPECYMDYPEIPPGMKAYLYTFDPKDPQETDWYGIRPTPEELLAKKNFQPSPRTYRTTPKPQIIRTGTQALPPEVSMSQLSYCSGGQGRASQQAASQKLQSQPSDGKKATAEDRSPG